MCKILFAIFLAGKLALGGGEQGVAIHRGKHPIGFRHKLFDFFLTVDDKGQGGCLHPADREHLTVLAVFQRIKSCGVHAQYPVANGPTESCQIKRLVILLVAQGLESLLDGLVGHRRNPEPPHGAFGLCLLHHPALDEFTFLAGVAAVDDAIGLLHQFFNHGKLPAYALVVDQFDAKPRGQHGQRAEAPAFPHRGIVIGFFQCAQMSESPCHLIAISLHVAVVRCGGTDNTCDILGHTWFLCNTNNHDLPSCLKISLRLNSPNLHLPAPRCAGLRDVNFS